MKSFIAKNWFKILVSFCLLLLSVSISSLSYIYISAYSDCLKNYSILDDGGRFNNIISHAPQSHSFICIGILNGKSP